MVIHKTFADFVLFLYLHMAYADGVFHPTERVVILNKMKKIFPKEGNLQKKLESAEKEYLSTKPADVGGIILNTFKHFKNIKFAQKYKVYTDMYDVLQADGKVEESEQYILDELKKIIDLGAEAKG